MTRICSLATAIVLCVACSTASAIWEVYDKGAWPKNWPKALEPLRERSGSIRGSELDLVIHRIPFTKREEFESTWPHLLKVKTKGAPLILVRSPGSHWSFGETKAGVLIHCPPGGDEPKEPAGPVPGQDNFILKWLNTTYIELIVDGEIIDLNRIRLPEDTPIIDQRFNNAQKTD
jgi:hypothetical protein